jgi:uncharacterized protein
MKSAIILHGMPSREEYFNPESPAQSNKHWLPWLQRQLLLQGILAQTPELPQPFAPLYEQWLQVFEQFKVNQDTLLIGHSCGAGFLVRWLSQHVQQVGKVGLVAPFLDPDHDEVTSGFFDFTINNTLIERTAGVGVFVSTDDDSEILRSVDQIKLALPAVQTFQFADKGHFTAGDMKTEQFRELLHWLIN